MRVIYFLLLLTLPIHSLFAEKIGLLVMATGKYTRFIDPLVESARKYFCKGHTVTYFVFTDGQIPLAEDIVPIYQSRLGWPFDTMMRYHVYVKNAALFSDQDYLFACDADMLFVDTVGDEILSERVATLHPGFIAQRGSYDCNPQSLAYVATAEGDHYFAGGFYGGSRQEMLNIAHMLSSCIDQDLNRGIIPVWHDESYWNRYCIDYPPTLILSPAYLYPESWDIPYPKKLLALDKNHQEMRTE